MKNLIYFLLLCLLSVQIVKAQDACNPYYALKAGKSWTLDHYNKKDKLIGSSEFEVISSKADGDGQLITVAVKSFDKKGSPEFEKEIEYRCENGKIEFDMSSYIPEESMEAFKDMEMEIEMDPIVMPEKLTIGDELKDASMQFTISGPMKMKMNYYMEDRTVMAKEKITVPAGSFDAYKINSTMRFESMMSRDFKIIDWIVEGIGGVKSETYNNKGKLMNYSVLRTYSN